VRRFESSRGHSCDVSQFLDKRTVAISRDCAWESAEGSSRKWRKIAPSIRLVVPDGMGVVLFAVEILLSLNLLA
jgi:hypothetical protein